MAATADLCLWVTDATVPPVWPEPPSGPVLHVVNKIDLPTAWDVPAAGEVLQVSARTGQGLQELCAAMASRLVPGPPPPGAAVPFTAEWCESLREASGGR